MDNIKDDIKAIRSDVADIKTTLAVNTESLVHHVRRTDAAERRIEKLEDWALKLLGALVGSGILAVLAWAAKLLFV
jgi:hypothetical protein